MITTTTTAPPGAGPDAHANAERIGLADPSRFRTLRRVPILDIHPSIKKTVRDLDAATEDNPGGVVQQSIDCDESDLAELARNSNRRAAAGRPAIVQIGHTPFVDKPESEMPKAIGFADGFEVGSVDGTPHLFANINYRSEFHREAMTYPRLSIERAGWSDPEAHSVTAIALIRRAPERDLPAVPYSAEAGGGQWVRYGRDLPSPVGGEEPAVDTDPAEAAPGPTPTPERNAFMDPEQMATFGKMLTESIVAGINAAKPAAPCETTPMPDPVTTPAAETSNYEASPAGTNTGYVPGSDDDKDKDKMAEYARACYAREVAPVLAVINGLTKKVETLEQANAGLAGKVEALTCAAEDAQLTAERANYSRIIDDSVKEGTILDEEARSDLMAMVYGLPDERREPALRKQLASYARSSAGHGFVPGPSRDLAPNSDEAQRKKRLNWMGIKGLTGDAGRLAYEQARAAGQV